MTKSLFGSVLREPFLHFMLLGAVLFVLYYEVADPGLESDDLIVVTLSDSARLTAGWERRWGRPPLQHEYEALVQSFVREEVLNREAKALGLDTDDAIIRRRLAQKMEFLFADLADQIEITDEELQEFLDENPERFSIPETAAFSHIYFSVDRRGDSTRGDAESLLAELTEDEGLSELSGRGDPFMYQYAFQDQSEAEVARLFGSRFASELFKLAPGGWTGPVESGFGVHLVRVESRTESRLPPLGELRDEVSYELKSKRQKEADAAFYQNLEQRYRVEIEQPELAATESG